MPRTLRDPLARHVRAARRARALPGGQPGRTQDTGDRETALKPASGKAQGTEAKHRERVPAELLAEFTAATGQQSPGHPSRPGYAISHSCR
jgi:hypothetical protein